MNENTHDLTQRDWEDRSRALFRASVDGLDMPMRSRLTRARHAALERATVSRPWLLRTAVWTPAAGVAAAALLGVALWFGVPGLSNGSHGSGDSQTNLEDLDMVASSDGGPGDALELLQDDIDFYAFADKTAGPGPAA